MAENEGSNPDDRKLRQTGTGVKITDPFSPVNLRGLNLKNRFIKSATYEGMCWEGIPLPALSEFHEQMAAGGISMTTVAYGAVNNEGRTHHHQMVINKQVLPHLRKLTETVHRQDCAASLQLTHCGYFTKNNTIKGKRPKAPSRQLNLYGLTEGLFLSKAMSEKEIVKTARDFARTAELALSAGFDALEIHMGHGYLISQFLSPSTNRRKDRYGGTVENRLRFPLMVLEKIREATGENVPLLCKMNLDDGFPGGLTIDESVLVARALERSGADALILSGGSTSRTPFYLMRGDVPLKRMISTEKNVLQKIAMALFGRLIIREYPFEENFFLPLARKIRESVKIPLIYLGGVVSAEGIRQIMGEGFEMTAIGRALIHDPDFIKKIRDIGDHVSPCNHCNLCVAEMDRLGVRCLIDES